MNLYEIDSKILNILENDEIFSIDYETGEVLKLDQLEIDRKTKLENIGCYIKNLQAETFALRQEEINLQNRRKVKENKIESLKKYITNSMLTFGDIKLDTPKIALSFRKSYSVKINDEKLIPERYRNIKIDFFKSEIQAVLRTGQEVSGAELVENQNLQIK